MCPREETRVELRFWKERKGPLLLTHCGSFPREGWCPGNPQDGSVIILWVGADSSRASQVARGPGVTCSPLVRIWAGVPLFILTQCGMEHSASAEIISSNSHLQTIVPELEKEYVFNILTDSIV